jgi:hypothetical protein
MITFIAATAPAKFLDVGARSPADASGPASTTCWPGRALAERAGPPGRGSIGALRRRPT